MENKKELKNSKKARIIKAIVLMLSVIIWCVIYIAFDLSTTVGTIGAVITFFLTLYGMMSLAFVNKEEYFLEEFYNQFRERFLSSITGVLMIISIFLAIPFLFLLFEDPLKLFANIEGAGYIRLGIAAGYVLMIDIFAIVNKNK